MCPKIVAAQRVGRCVVGPNTRLAEPFTGRANIFSEHAGLAIVDVPAVHALNAIDERVTLATVPNFERVASGQMLATMKIIPFAVPDHIVKSAERQISTGLVRVAPFAPHRAGLVLTAFNSTKPQILDRRRQAVEHRLTSLGSVLAEVRTVAHTSEATANAIRELAAHNLSPILIFAASAIVDRDDVIPAGLVAAGGTITRLGMPVDPGNLLLLGQLGTTPVIGLPSCAGSLKLNGFDWVLERCLADIEVSAADIATMGHGGLLKEIETRPQPRLGGTSDMSDSARRAPRIAAVILAAGRSQRMGLDHKLLADVRGSTLLRHVVRTALRSNAHPIHVVVGHRSAEIMRSLAGHNVAFVTNPNYVQGLSTSMQAGLSSLPDDCDGAIIMLGDMPDIEPALIDRMISAFEPKEGRGIVVPVSGGKRGNPVLWGRDYFAAMAEVSGDTGAKPLLALNADAIVEIPASEAVHTDIDTPEALAALRQRKPAKRQSPT